MDNNRIFLEFWQQHQWQEPEPVLFRLYHDEAGRPREYSQQRLPGAFIDITPEQFARADFRVRVVSGVIVPQEPPPPPRLVRSDHGQRCDPRDITVITDREPYQAWSMTQDEN